MTVIIRTSTQSRSNIMKHVSRTHPVPMTDQKANSIPNPTSPPRPIPSYSSPMTASASVSPSPPSHHTHPSSATFATIPESNSPKHRSSTSHQPPLSVFILLFICSSHPASTCPSACAYHAWRERPFSRPLEMRSPFSTLTISVNDRLFSMTPHSGDSIRIRPGRNDGSRSGSEDRIDQDFVARHQHTVACRELLLLESAPEYLVRPKQLHQRRSRRPARWSRMKYAMISGESMEKGHIAESTRCLRIDDKTAVADLAELRQKVAEVANEKVVKAADPVAFSKESTMMRAIRGTISCKGCIETFGKTFATVEKEQENLFSSDLTICKRVSLNCLYA